MQPITIRKTLGRLAYYASEIKSGKEHKKILESMGFTEDDFQYLIEKSSEFANNDDYDLDVVLTDQIHKSPIGGCFITKNGANIAWL